MNYLQPIPDRLEKILNTILQEIHKTRGASCIHNTGITIVTNTNLHFFLVINTGLNVILPLTKIYLEHHTSSSENHQYQNINLTVFHMFLDINMLMFLYSWSWW